MLLTFKIQKGRCPNAPFANNTPGKAFDSILNHSNLLDKLYKMRILATLCLKKKFFKKDRTHPSTMRNLGMQNSFDDNLRENGDTQSCKLT